MNRVLLDANVFIHARGENAQLRSECLAIIEHLAARRLVGEASSLMIEEIVHVRHRRTGDRGRAIADGRTAAAMLSVMHPVGEEELEAAWEAFRRHDRLQARDAIHLAVARSHSLMTILSTDRGFDGIEGLRRVDPADHDAVHKLAAG